MARLFVIIMRCYGCKKISKHVVILKQLSERDLTRCPSCNGIRTTAIGFKPVDPLRLKLDLGLDVK